MPSYKAIKTGFYEGATYSPSGKRKILTVDKPFKKCPSWLEPIKGESASEVKARKAAETKRINAEKKKAEEDKKAVDAVTFTSSPEQITKTL